MKAVQHEINLSHRMLSTCYKIDEVEKIEMEIKKKVEQCDSSITANKNIVKEIYKCDKEVDAIGENGMYEDEVHKLTNEFKNDKAKIRELYNDNLRRKKELIDVHEVLVNKEINVRKMKELVETTRKEKSNSSRYEITKPESIFTGKKWNLNEIKKKSDAAMLKMKKAQTKIVKVDLSQQDKIRDIQHQINILKIKLKEKGKEFSLANLKIKEINRNFKYKSLKPLLIHPTSSKKRSTSINRKSTEVGKLYNLR
jgi:hypothetical protein